jgi:MFS family permease
LTSRQAVPLRRVIFIFSLTNLLIGLLNGFIGPLLNGFLMFRLGADPTEYGLVLSVAFGVITGLVQVPGGKLADKFGRKPLVLFSFLSVPLVFVLAFSRSLLEFSLIMGAISAVGNISSPAISAWLMDLVPQHKRASVSGITQTLTGVGLSAGPTAGSYVWNSTKPDASIPCGVAALIFAVALPFYLILAEPRKSSQQAVEAS